jgi:hypothetical protein
MADPMAEMMCPRCLAGIAHHCEQPQSRTLWRAEELLGHMIENARLVHPRHSWPPSVQEQIRRIKALAERAVAELEAER